ncbi:conserved exported hypothetical protein [Xenorhabdus nematophila str. Anatoliense]|nr:conserved exported hypothetical protein [Xenorhabdus nematophila str. Anatoliense]
MPLVLGAPAAGAALVAAAEWTLAACVTGLAALGIIEVTKDATAEDVIPIKPKSRTEEQIENDIALGETKSKSRLEEIAKTGALARSKEKCKSCPASTGIPTNEKRSFGNDINAEYQIYITKALSGPGWFQEWTYAAVSFDGFQLPYCLLQETKGAYDQFFIAENQIKKFWSGV